MIDEVDEANVVFSVIENLLWIEMHLLETGKEARVFFSRQPREYLVSDRRLISEGECEHLDLPNFGSRSVNPGETYLAHETNSFACIKLCNCEAMYTDSDLRKFRERKKSRRSLVRVLDHHVVAASLLLEHNEIFIAAFGERSKNVWRVSVCEELLRIVKSKHCARRFKNSQAQECSIQLR